MVALLIIVGFVVVVSHSRQNLFPPWGFGTGVAASDWEVIITLPSISVSMSRVALLGVYPVSLAPKALVLLVLKALCALSVT